MSIEDLIEQGVTEEELASFAKFVALFSGAVESVVFSRQDLENCLHIIARTSTEEGLVETHKIIKGLKELL